MTWPFVSIAELCDEVVVGHVGPSSQVRDPAGVPFLMGKNVGPGFLKLDELERVNRTFHESQRKSQLAAGDIVVVRIGASGQAAKIPEGFGAANCAGLVVIKRPRRIDADYLVHYLNSSTGRRESLSKTKGATRQTLNTKLIASTLVPVPPIAEQRRIAVTLDKYAAIRGKRAQATKDLDEIIRSCFSAMFGNPLRDASRWPLEPIARLGQVSTGKTPPTAQAGMFGGDLPFATPGDIDVGLASTVRTLTAEGADWSRVVREGSTLVCCIGTVGKAARTPRKTAFNQQINAVEWGTKINDYFGAYLLQILGPKMASLAASTTVPILNKGLFSTVELPVPPRPLQDKFAAILASTERTFQSFAMVDLEAIRLGAQIQNSVFPIGR